MVLNETRGDGCALIVDKSPISSTERGILSAAEKYFFPLWQFDIIVCSDLAAEPLRPGRRLGRAATGLSLAVDLPMQAPRVRQTMSVGKQSGGMAMRIRWALAVAALAATAVWPVAAFAANYPVATGPLTVSSTSAQPGQPVTTSGSGFAGASMVTIQIFSTPRTLASVHAGADGSFTAQVTIPSDMTGSHTLQATGVTPDGATLVLSSPISIAGASSGTTSSGMAFTGANVLIPTVAACGLIAAGGVLIVSRRRAKRPVA